ncbi:MAG: hypothetical protein J4N95_05365 [Chloroflexi bacterium]|nr:hypothetical protein [Chloroflexota bacterium]
MSRLLEINARFVQSRTSFMLGLLCALTGAGLATGIMAYDAIANDMEFTAQSWILIAPIWLGLAALWMATLRWPFFGGLPLGLLAFYAGGYFSDVHGQYPAGLLLFLASAAVIAAATETEREGDLAQPAHVE